MRSDAIYNAIVKQDVMALEGLLLGGKYKETGRRSRLISKDPHTPDGSSLLHLAAVAKHHATCMMRILLKAGMNVNVRDREGRTALLYLVQKAKDTVRLRAEVLLDYGINLNTRDKNNETALAAAWRRGSPDAEITTTLLLERGADPNTRLNDEMEQTLLHCAVKRGNRRFVNSLLQQFHADANAKDRDGQTPLHLVAAGFGSGLSQLVTLLIDGGGDPCAVDSFGRTPLMLACSHDSLFFTGIYTLLESVEESKRGSYINAQDTFGNCALGYAMTSPRGASTVLHLLEASADPFLLDPAGSVVLMGLLRRVSVCNADATLMAIIKLLEHGCNPNLPDSSGQTALHVLAKHPELRQMPQHLRVLLNHGADPTIRDHKGNLPLHYVCSNEFNATSVFILLQHMIGRGVFSSHGYVSHQKRTSRNVKAPSACLLEHAAQRVMRLNQLRPSPQWKTTWPRRVGGREENLNGPSARLLEHATQRLMRLNQLRPSRQWTTTRRMDSRKEQ